MNNLADQLKAVKLKRPSGPLRDFSSPKTAGFIQQEEIDNYQQSVLDANTEEWLDILKDNTFPTDFLAISKEEAQLFVTIYETLFQNLSPESISQIEWQERISQDQKLSILSMKENLQTLINTFIKSENDFVFIKLSSRSPKDAPMAQKRFKTMYETFLSQETETDRQSENIQISCILKAGFESLRVSKAEEIIDMCIRSERVYQDLLLALAVPDRFRENWVVRKFVHIDVDMEFRGFVYEQNLTALSQYNYLIFSKRLAQNKDHYCNLIKSFFEEQIQPKMKAFLNNYIIDFAVCDNDKIWVIEINPFLATTDSALFSWEHELPILQGSQDSLVFKVTERPRPGAKAMLPIGMKDMINQHMAETNGIGSSKDSP